MAFVTSTLPIFLSLLADDLVAIGLFVGVPWALFTIYIVRIWADRKLPVGIGQRERQSVEALNKQHQRSVDDVARDVRLLRAEADETERTNFNVWKSKFLARRTQFYKDIGFE